MEIPFFHVDAFTDRLFGGNPAVVCPLDAWLPDEALRQIAMENAVTETAFFLRSEAGYSIRWFTAEMEMDLCGHATLATAHVLARHLSPGLAQVSFASRSGPLHVRMDGELITLDLPARDCAPCEVPAPILEAFNRRPVATLKSRGYVLVFADEEDIVGLQPDRALLDRVSEGPEGIIVTAPGRKVDFVSRFFAPRASIFEDPVTGSAHCTLVPYWAARLSKDRLTADQLSPRGGRLFCQLRGDRVLLAGRAVTYSTGSIRL